MQPSLFAKARHLTTAIILAIPALLVSAPALAQHEIGTHGYLRIGAGFSGYAEERACYQAPGADWKFRLGNECDTWIEGGIHDLWTVREGGPTIFTQIWLGTSIAEGRWNPFRFHNFTQMYLQASDIEELGKNTKVWIGRKYYQRHDIHINDFYWSEMLGDGFGVEDVELGFGKLMYAYTRSNSFADSPAPDLTSESFQNNHDLRLTDIAVSPTSKLTLQAWFAHANGSYVNGERHAVPTKGFTLAAWHEGTFGSLWNKASIQYGRGLTRYKLRAWNPDAAATLTHEAADDLLTATILRITEQFLLEPSKRVALFGAFVFQKEDGGDYDATDLTWYALGLRPMYFFNETFRGLAELSWDRTENGATGLEGNLFKLTLAGEISTDLGFWNRPVLRTFFTLARWSDAFDGIAGGSGDGGDTRCTERPYSLCYSAGVQAEYWW